MTGRDTSIVTPACAAETPQAGVRPWLKLIIGIALILAFIFGIGSLAQRIPGARHMANVIDDHDLRPSAIYYTDFEASAEGSESIRDSLDYTPHGKP
jgi:hypothetical protein